MNESRNAYYAASASAAVKSQVELPNAPSNKPRQAKDASHSPLKNSESSSSSAFDSFHQMISTELYEMEGDNTPNSGVHMRGRKSTAPWTQTRREHETTRLPYDGRTIEDNHSYSSDLSNHVGSRFHYSSGPTQQEKNNKEPKGMINEAVGTSQDHPSSSRSAHTVISESYYRSHSAKRKKETSKRKGSDHPSFSSRDRERICETPRDWLTLTPASEYAMKDQQLSAVEFGQLYPSSVNASNSSQNDQEAATIYRMKEQGLDVDEFERRNPSAIVVPTQTVQAVAVAELNTEEMRYPTVPIYIPQTLPTSVSPHQTQVPINMHAAPPYLRNTSTDEEQGGQPSAEGSSLPSHSLAGQSFKDTSTGRTQSTHPSSFSPHSKKRGLWYILILLTVGVIIGVVAGVTFSSRSSSKTAALTTTAASTTAPTTVPTRVPQSNSMGVTVAPTMAPSTADVVTTASPTTFPPSALPTTLAPTPSPTAPSCPCKIITVVAITFDVNDCFACGNPEGFVDLGVQLIGSGSLNYQRVGRFSENGRKTFQFEHPQTVLKDDILWFRVTEEDTTSDNDIIQASSPFNSGTFPEWYDNTCDSYARTFQISSQDGSAAFEMSISGLPAQECRRN